ncbi:hypothetical protein D3C77_803830 [compost metagenome]
MGKPISDSITQRLIMSRFQKRATGLHHLSGIARIARTLMLNRQQIHVPFFRLVKPVPLRTGIAVFFARQQRVA